MTGEETLVLEKIIEHIRSENLNAGQKIPSERQLSERLGVSRGYVRKALQRLEHYGILRTLPQRGTVVEKIGGKALAGIVQAIIQVDEEEDVRSIMDTREVLERYSARLAAERAGPGERAAIEAAHEAFHQAALSGQKTLDEDHLFHLAIARACGNGVTLSLISMLTPKIIAMNVDFKERDAERFMATYREHQKVVEAIAAGDADGAEKAMAEHMAASKARRLVGTA